MNPKSGKAGQAVTPSAPEVAQDADVADPVQTAKTKAEQVEQKKGKYGSTPIEPYKPPKTPEKEEEEEQEEEERTSWIEIELVDEEDQPVPGEKYRITLPDGKVAAGTLDEKGFARIDHIVPGTCQITFPRLDKNAWEPA